MQSLGPRRQPLQPSRLKRTPPRATCKQRLRSSAVTWRFADPPLGRSASKTPPPPPPLSFIGAKFYRSRIISNVWTSVQEVQGHCINVDVGVHMPQLVWHCLWQLLDGGQSRACPQRL